MASRLSEPDPKLQAFETYYDYVDDNVLTADRYYLVKETTCHKLVDFGYRTAEKVLTEAEFNIERAAFLENSLRGKRGRVFYSESIYPKDPILRALAAREKYNAHQIISTIIFLMYERPNGFYISSYIDYEHDLRKANADLVGCRDWRAIFRGERKIIPMRKDLSYLDWRNGSVNVTDTDNWQVLNNASSGLTFMHSSDHKKICMNKLSTNFQRNRNSLTLFSEYYGHVVIYDHVIRKKV